MHNNALPTSLWFKKKSLTKEIAILSRPECAVINIWRDFDAGTLRIIAATGTVVLVFNVRYLSFIFVCVNSNNVLWFFKGTSRLTPPHFRILLI